MSKKTDLGLIRGVWVLMVSQLSSYEAMRKYLSYSVVLSSVVLVACNNTKPVDIVAVPTPEPATQHRLALSDVNDNQEALAKSQLLASLPAETSNKTKFSSKTFGVKGSPRITTTRNVRKGGGRYQIGKPYTIRGKKYFPRLDPDLRQTGLASWYGPNFHGRLTANGEVYDQYALSAAHPTMPLPSYAKVTNLENGSSVTVRVNDRGPFSKKRVIDLSARAAQLLGYTKQGVAKVRVEYAGKAPLHGLDEDVLLASYNPGSVDQNSIPRLPGQNVVLAQAAKSTNVPAQNRISSAAGIGFAPPTPVARETVQNIPRPAGLVNSYIDDVNTPAQNEAFAFFDKSQIMTEPNVGMKDLTRIKFGPFDTQSAADEAEQKLTDFGIIQHINSDTNNKLLLVILGAEDAGKALGAAKSAEISIYLEQ